MTSQVAIDLYVMRQQKDKWYNMVLVGEKLQEATDGLPTAVQSMKLPSGQSREQ